VSCPRQFPSVRWTTRRSPAHGIGVGVPSLGRIRRRVGRTRPATRQFVVPSIGGKPGPPWDEGVDNSRPEPVKCQRRPKMNPLATLGFRSCRNAPVGEGACCWDDEDVRRGWRLRPSTGADPGSARWRHARGRGSPARPDTGGGSSAAGCHRGGWPRRSGARGICRCWSGNGSRPCAGRAWRCQHGKRGLLR
jgi:hypothetical protein